VKETATRRASDSFSLKTSASATVTANHSAGTSDKRKKLRNIIFFLLLLFFLAFCVFAVIMRLKDSNITLWKMLNLQNLSILPKKSVIQTRPAKLLTDQKVTQKIPTTGGSATLTTNTGYTYTVTIGPGVLTTDSTLTLTPLEEPPFTWPSDPQGNNPPDDPGIDITVDPPLPPTDPPADPTDGGPIDPDNPTDPSDGGPPPIDIEVTFTPSEPEPGTVVPDSQDPNIMARRIMESAGLGNMMALISTTPSVTPKPAGPNHSNRAGKTPRFFVFIPRRGSPRILPLGPPVGKPNGQPDSTPPGEPEPPTGGNGDTPDEGTITPEDPKDKGKADDAANQAGANGHCTDEYIFAYSQAYANAKAAGDTAGMQNYGGSLKDCAKDKLSYLKRLCEVDRRLLRRLDFTQYKQSLSGVPDSDTLLTEAIQLEKKCKGYYWISGSGSPVGSTGEVTMKSTIDTSVCGYFDDQWQGKDAYTLNVYGGEGVHAYNGTHTFRLPSRGGTFFSKDTPVSQGLTIIGKSVDVAMPNLGFLGTFDGLFTIDFLLYPMAELKMTIPLVSTDCTEPSGEIPVIPLGPGTDKGEPKQKQLIPTIPIEPLTTTKEIPPTIPAVPLVPQ